MKAILIKNGILYDLKKDEYDKKDLIMRDGKIIEISENLSEQYKDTEVIDLKEKFVFPGFIDCHTHLGIIEECTGKIGADNNETSDPVTPHLNGIDGINPLDVSFKDAIKSITVNAAEILNCQDRIGELEVSYDADIVVYDGNPLDIKSKVELTIIDGEIVFKRE